MVLNVQARWRASLKGTHVPNAEDVAQSHLFSFAKGKLSDADFDLLVGGTTGNYADTELLAYLAGFMATMVSAPPPDASGFVSGKMPRALEQLSGPLRHNWGLTEKPVRALAKSHLQDLYAHLPAAQQDRVRDWLFWVHLRATTPWPAAAKGPDADAARLVFGVFGKNPDYLEFVMEAIGEKEFAAHKLPAPANQSKVNGITLPKPSQAVKVGSGVAKVFVGVQYTFGSQPAKHGISLSYDGPDAGDMRWLQFIWREVVPDHGTGVTGKSVHQSKEYPLTTQPSEPSQIGWNVDSATYLGGPESAFMQMDAAVNRTATHLQIFDEPSAPFPEHVKLAFQAPGLGAGGVTGRAHLVQFLVHGQDVLLRAEETFEYRYDKVTDNPEAKPSFVSAKPATAIDPGARARLHEMYKDLDFIP
jgi:hypothetical protein